MGNKLSVTEAALLGTSGLMGALAIHYRNESLAQKRRKNELAWTLLNQSPLAKSEKRQASSEYGRNFKPRPSDVFIVTYPKCGTTWMSQICHVLRGGDMSFSEITEVCPWDENAKMCGQDLDADQVRSPRIFKSHLRREEIAKGGKYIYVVRHPEDVFVSYFHFTSGFRGLKPGDFTMHQFEEEVMGGQRGPIWDHYMGWHAVRGDPAVLWVFFEDLKEDFRGQVERVADFMEIPGDVRARRVEEALQKASFEFMSKHKNQFDDNFLRKHTNPKKESQEGKVNKEKGGKVGKVRKGKTGQGSQIPRDIRKRLQEQWRQRIGTKTGCQDYDSLRKSFRSK